MSSRTLFGRNPAIQLVFLAAISFIIYAVGFVRPYSLQEWWSVPLMTIPKIGGFHRPADLAYVLTISPLFLLYILACRLTLGQTRRAVWGVVIGGTIAFCALLLFMYPVEAADVFDYIAHGRLTALYGANPFYQSPSEFPGDPLLKYAAWPTYLTVYGPVWELIAAAGARIAGDDVITNVLVFKAIPLLAFAGTAVLIVLTLRRRAPARALYGLTLFVWNPVALYSIAGNGHNDAVMVFFLVFGFYLLARGHYTLAALAETGGALVKYFPALVWPIIIVAGLRQLPDWRARVRYLTVTMLACAALVALTFAPFWRGGDMLGFDRHAVLFTTSLPTLLEVNLETMVEQPFAEWLAGRAALILLAAWVLREMRIVWQKLEDRHADILIVSAQAGLSILLFCLLVSIFWFQPWYTIWPLALAALLPINTLTIGSIVLTIAASFKLPLFDVILGPNGSLPPRAWREQWITLTTLGAAWLYFVYHWARRRMKISRPRLVLERSAETISAE